MHLAEIVATVRADPGGTLLALDFDGTLAPIVPDPADSRPLPGAVGALITLAGRGARIAVITGRDARTLFELSGLERVPGLAVEALYGAESWHAGQLRTPTTPAETEALRARLPVIIAEGADPALWIEDKRLSLVVHGRLADDPERALDPVRVPIAALAAELGLEVHAGRGVIELRLPGFDKAGALRRLVDQFAPRQVVFAGDDVGDLPAFAEIRAMRAAGATAWGLGVLSPEVSELDGAADVCIDGPPAMLDLLRALAA